MTVNRVNKVRISPKTWKRVFWIVLGITTTIRLIYALKLPLTGDEAYFWEWARHPALSYYDHPPLAGWILAMTTSIFGSTVAGIRIPAVLAMSLVFVFLHRMTYEISGSQQTASLAGLLAMGIPLLEVGGILYSTDTPLMLSGILGGYFFYRAIEHGSRRAWIGLGVCSGTAVMSKFLGAALPAACVFYLLLSKPHRHHLRSRGPYIAAGLAGLIFLPAVAWNASHGWATFVFNFASRHKTPGINLVYTADYFIGQALAMSPLVLIFAIPAFFVFFPSRSRAYSAWNIPALLALVPLAGFLLISLTNRVGAHWPGIGYPFLAIAVTGYLTRGERTGLKYISTAVTAWITVLILLSIPLMLWLLPQDWSYPLRPEKFNTAQVKKALIPPEETGQTVSRLFADMEDQGAAFLFTRSYALSSLIAFYTTGQPEVTVLGTGSVHGRNHVLWFNAQDHINENALFVSYRSFENEKEFLKERFERIEVVSDSAVDPDGASLTLIKCYGYNGMR